MHRMGRRLGAGALATALVFAAMLGSAAIAGAAEGADLSIRQTFAINTPSNELVVTDHVANAGPGDAQYVTLVTLVKTSSSGLAVRSGRGVACQFQAPPPGWSDMISCEDVTAVAAGTTWKPRFTLTGDPGTALTSRVSVGAFTPDPDTANNLSTLRTGFGASDLAVSESGGPTSFPLTDTTTATIRNRGPVTATSLEFDIFVTASSSLQGGWSTDQEGGGLHRDRTAARRLRTGGVVCPRRPRAPCHVDHHRSVPRRTR